VPSLACGPLPYGRLNLARTALSLAQEQVGVQHGKIPSDRSEMGQTTTSAFGVLECAPGAGQVEVSDLTG